MAGTRRKTKEEFIQDAQKVWGGRYDYSLVDYVNNKTKVKIRCKKHNVVFEQRPFDHVVMKQRRCPQCQEEIKEEVRKRRATGTEEFVRRAKEKFGDSFDYSRVEYVNSITPVKIVCIKGGHGPFMMRPHTHLSSAHGCRQCGMVAAGKSQRISKEEFLERAKQKFGSKFDYSQMSYTDYNSPVNLICGEHGELEIAPFLHLLYPSGGCKECSKEIQSASVRKMTTEQFVEKAISVHDGKYDYSNAKYTSGSRPVSIRCLKHNINFEISRRRGKSPWISPHATKPKYLSTTELMSEKSVTFAPWQRDIHHSTTRRWCASCFPTAFLITSRLQRSTRK